MGNEKPDYLEESQRCLTLAALAYIVQFEEGTFSVDYNSQTFTFKFPYRDSWKIYQNWITNPTLAEEIHWYPVPKYLCRDGEEVAMYDEVNHTGTLWWDVQVHLARSFGLHLSELSPHSHRDWQDTIVSSPLFFGSTKA